MPNALFDSWTFSLPMPSGRRFQPSKEFTSELNRRGAMVSLHRPTVDALMMYSSIKAGKQPENEIFGIGKKDNYILAEVQKNGREEFVCYDKESKKFLVCTYDEGTKSDEAYYVRKNEHTGKLMLFAMMPELEKNSNELELIVKELTALIQSGNSIEDIVGNIETSTDIRRCIFTACDNIYRQVSYSEEPPCIINNSGKIDELTDFAIESGIYAPDRIIAGQFSDKFLKNAVSKIGTPISPNELKGFALDKDRSYTEEEKALIPELPDWYIVPKYLSDACKLITGTAKRKVRNIMLRGEAGTGKTEAAKAMAAALHLPYVSLGCHPDMQINDFTGTILPKIQKSSNQSSEKNSNGTLPTFEDIEMDCSFAYEKLTGEEAPENITEEDVFNLLIQKVSECAVCENGSNGIEYEYCDSPLVRAIKNGWLCEIQEPAIIERAGVLAGLNSLLDTCQSVTLPTGETIKRHPDCVIVITTNTTYQGCKEINNSVLSRMQFKVDTELPTDGELAERVTKITGFNEKILLQMIKVVEEIHTFCQENMITDGCCGVRELIDWVQAYQALGDVIEAAMYTVIPSASTDLNSQAEIKKACLDTIIKKN